MELTFWRIAGPRSSPAGLPSASRHDVRVCGRSEGQLPMREENPRRVRWPPRVILAMLSIIGVIWWAVENTPEKVAAREAAAAAEVAAKAAEEAWCQQDQTCMGKKLFDAPFDCQDRIENMAKHDFQWTDKWPEQK